MNIDFSLLAIKKKAYGGANESKLSVIYNDEICMLKFPSYVPKNPNLSYGIVAFLNI